MRRTGSFRAHLLTLLALAASGCGGGRPSGPAGGDLSGDYPDPTVEGLQGQRFGVAGAQAGQVLMFSGAEWQATNLPVLAEPAVRVVAAGVFNADGTPVGPVVGGLQLNASSAQTNPRAYMVTFDGYSQPDTAHTYIVNVQPLISENARVAVSGFSETFFGIVARQLGEGHQLAVEVKEIREQ